MDNLQIKTQVFFLIETVPMLNEHLTYQDEEMGLSLITIVDQFKSIEDDSFKGAIELSDAAFSVDEKISYNIPATGAPRKKAAQRQDEMNQMTRILRILSDS